MLLWRGTERPIWVPEQPLSLIAQGFFSSFQNTLRLGGERRGKPRRQGVLTRFPGLARLLRFQEGPAEIIIVLRRRAGFSARSPEEVAKARANTLFSKLSSPRKRACWKTTVEELKSKVNPPTLQRPGVGVEGWKSTAWPWPRGRLPQRKNGKLFRRVREKVYSVSRLSAAA